MASDFRRFVLPACILFSSSFVGASSKPDFPPDVSVFQIAQYVWYAGKATFEGLPSRPPCSQRTNAASGEVPDKEWKLPVSLPSKVQAAASPAALLPMAVRQGSTLAGFDGLDAYIQKNSGTGRYQNSQGFDTPPDVAGCVGGGYIVQTVNTVVGVYDTKGRVKAGPVPHNQFLGLSPLNASGDSTFDSSCKYDKDLDRFFWLTAWQYSGSSPWGCLGQARQGGNGVVVAVSARGAPWKPWDVYFIPATNDGYKSKNDAWRPTFYANPPFEVDFPQMDIDPNGLYFTFVEFSQSDFAGYNIYGLSKKLLLGRANFRAVRFALPYFNSFLSSIGAIFPISPPPDKAAKADSRFGGTMYFGSTVPENALALWALTNTSSLDTAQPALTPHLTLVSTPTWVRLPPSYGVPQKGSSDEIKAGLNGYVGLSGTVVGAGRSVWLTWTQGVNGTAGVGVAQLDPTFTLSGTQLVLTASLAKYRVLAVPGQSLIYPALTVNGIGRGLLTFALVGSSYYPTGAYSRFAVGGTSIYPSIHPIVYVSRRAVKPLFSPVFDSPLRYGDWQTATTDSRGNLWGVVEYAGNLTDGNWATWIFQLRA